MRQQRIRRSSREVEQAARSMRQAPTPAEARLWEALRARKLDGRRFRRQHALGRFILDFVCASKRLVIELDDLVHIDRRERDEARQRALEGAGYRVLRFSNDRILEDLPEVLEQMRTALSRDP